MVIEEIREIRSGDREIRQFGITFAVMLGVVIPALIWITKHENVFVKCAVPAVFFLLAGFLMPKVLRPLQTAWMVFAVVMGWVMARAVLSILFFLVVTPIGIVIRLFGKNLLGMKADKKTESYWEKRQERIFDKQSCERQF